ncbi:MAG: hypothetical protein ACI4P4_01150, partial [Faecousia sp.]
IQEIATPVCALARNDRKFDTAPVGSSNSNLSGRFGANASALTLTENARNLPKNAPRQWSRGAFLW